VYTMYEPFPRRESRLTDMQSISISLVLREATNGCATPLSIQNISYSLTVKDQYNPTTTDVGAVEACIREERHANMGRQCGRH
jgi:hypothetical protein